MPSTDPQPSSKPRQRTLRFRLACLVLACIIPVCIIAGFVVNYAYQQKQALTEQQVLQTTRALSMVVDQQLATMQASASALAASNTLVRGDLAAFRRTAQKVLRNYPAGTTFALTDVTGQQLVNTFLPLGTPLPKRVLWDQVQRVFKTGEPVTINLYKGVVTKRTMVGVVVPVIRDGRVVYTLAVVTPASHFDAVVSQQGIPPGWIVGLDDANGVMVARNQLSEKYVGQRGTPYAEKRMSEADEGIFETTNREGIPVFTMFSRSTKSGWVTAIAIPKNIMLAGIRRWLWWTIGGVLLLLVIGTAGAAFLARRISGSIHALIAPALALGAGGPVALAQLDLAEANEVGQSLVKASQLLQQRSAERNQAEAALRESEQVLRTVTDQSRVGLVMLDKERRYVFANQAYCEVLRLPLHDIVGKPVPQVMAHVYEQISPRLDQAFAGERVNYELTMPDPGGSGTRFYAITYEPRRESGEVIGVIVVVVDLTERKRAEDSLRQSEERWSTTLHSIGDAVISTDAKGRVMFMNDVAEKLTGWPLSEARGHDLEEVFHIVNELTRYRPESPVAKVIRMGQVVGLANHTALLSRGGTELPIEDSGAPIRDKEGRITGVVLVFHDISEKRRAEKAVRDSERLAMTGRMASTLAHEIHNPLDTVGGLLYLIERDPDAPAEVRQHAALASEEVARVTQMTRHMLSFQRESKKPVPIKIGEILDNVIAMYQKKIESAAIKIEKQVEFEEEFIGLPGEMRQVIANLVGNAIEAIGKNGRIRLHAYSGTDWRQGRRGLRVTIADNGPGIPADVRDKIFDPFFTTKGEAGTGLGLWIISGIIENSDGTLRLRSVTGDGRSGTCFSVFFPFPA